MGRSFQVEKHTVGKSVEEGITCTLATHGVAQTCSLDSAELVRNADAQLPPRPRGQTAPGRC